MKEVMRRGGSWCMDEKDLAFVMIRTVILEVG